MTSARPSPVRRIVITLAVVALLLGGVAIGGLWYVWSAAPVDTVGSVRFERPLAIPPLADSRVDAEGQRIFDLTAQPGTSRLLPGVTTPTWGFNGGYLGPTLRAERGERVRVNVHNKLDETTTVHWHGMHLPGEMDGGPHQPVEPGTTWSPSWRIDQPTATLWYHPHPHGKTEDHVYRGLAGMFILDDPASRATDLLPHRYGLDDIPVIVQDKRFDDGRLDLGSGFMSGTGRLGGTILVNGTYGPRLDVSTEAVRLRLLNASTARVYDFGFSDDRTFDLVGTDGGLLPSPAPLTRIMLSPGERAEIVLRMQPGEETVLRSYPPGIGSGFLAGRFDGAHDRFDILKLRAGAHLEPFPELPHQLAPTPDLAANHLAASREFVLSGRSINRQKMDMDRIDATVERNTTEAWSITNRDGIPHNFHVHGVQFQVADVDRRPPPVELSGWKDTVFLPPATTVRIMLRFSGYADPDSPYMFHCHLLRHEDAGMMGQLVVVDPGDEPVVDTGGGTSDHQHHNH